MKASNPLLLKFTIKQLFCLFLLELKLSHSTNGPLLCKEENQPLSLHYLQRFSSYIFVLCFVQI